LRSQYISTLLHLICSLNSELSLWRIYKKNSLVVWMKKDHNYQMVQREIWSLVNNFRELKETLKKNLSKIRILRMKILIWFLKKTRNYSMNLYLKKPWEIKSCYLLSSKILKMQQWHLLTNPILVAPQYLTGRGWLTKSPIFLLKTTKKTKEVSLTINESILLQIDTIFLAVDNRHPKVFKPVGL